MDWSSLGVTTNYPSLISGLKERDADLAVGADPAHVTVTNPPTNMRRWASANRRDEKFNGTSWEPLSDYYDIELKAFTGDVTKPAGSSVLTIGNNVVTNAMLRDSAAVSVIGRSANSSGVPADIAAAGNDTILRRVSNALSFGQLTVGMFPDSVVTYAKIQNATAGNIVLGRVTGAGNIEEIACTAAGRSMLAAANAAAQLTLLSGVPDSRTITAGAGLTGGGNLTADRTLALSISGLTDWTFYNSEDYIAIHDVSVNALRKMPFSAVWANMPVQEHITAGTAQATTSGSSKDFTGIPSGVKRIQVMLIGVDQAPSIQIGDSGGVETSGYTGCYSYTAAGGATAASSLSSGFILSHISTAVSGIATLTNISGNYWAFSWSAGLTNSGGAVCGGYKQLSATLDRVRLLTSGTFSAGSVNIYYE